MSASRPVPTILQRFNEVKTIIFLGVALKMSNSTGCHALVQLRSCIAATNLRAYDVGSWISIFWLPANCLLLLLPKNLVWRLKPSLCLLFCEAVYQTGTVAHPIVDYSTSLYLGFYHYYMGVSTCISWILKISCFFTAAWAPIFYNPQSGSTHWTSLIPKARRTWCVHIQLVLTLEGCTLDQGSRPA